MKHKSLKAFALVLASGALLTSCGGSDKVYPSLSHDKITATTPFEKETLDILYEMIHDGSSTGSDVRDVIMEAIAKNILGEFKVTETGVEIVGYDGKSDADKLAFVKLHNAYWDKAKDEGNFVPVEPTALTDTIKDRVEVIRDLIFDNVVTKLFDEANTDSYKEHNVFKEYKFARDKIKTSDVAGFTYSDEQAAIENKKNIYSTLFEEDDCPDFHNNTIIGVEITKEDPSTIATNVLHLNYYSDYINKEVLPKIINTLLVEQYIFDNQYAALSRTQARKINYIEIQATKDTYTAATLLAKEFIRSNIVTASIDTDINYEILAEAWKGTPNMSEAAKGLLEADAVAKYFAPVTEHRIALGGDSTSPVTSYIDGQEHNYFKNTQYGKLIEDFAKINTNIHDTESNTKHSEFSNSGAYTVTKGLTYKTRDIEVKDYTTNAWGTKDNGFSSLPAEIKTSLFDYSVGADVPAKKTESSVEKPASKIVNVNGHYFLKALDTPTNNPEDTLLHKNPSTNSLYIVEVEHALSQTKLSYATEGDKAYDAKTREEISREIGYTMASTDTYKNTAYLHYLKNCGIEYHDQSIYDFMKDTYPDLFEEDK